MPRLSLAEIYTDNVDHDPDLLREHDFVTQIQPGVTVLRSSPWVKLDLDYQLQGLVYARGTNNDTVYQRLVGQLQAEPLPGWFHVDADATIGQTIIDATRNLSVTNVVGRSNRTEVRTFGIAPYLSHETYWFKVLARAEREITRYQSGGASDSDATLYDFRLGDAGHAPALGWSLSYQDRKYDRSSAQDVRFRDLEASVRYRVVRQMYLVMRAGRTDNSYQGVDDRRNGGYWAAGVGWKSRLFSIDLLGGDNDEGAVLSWTPNTRTAVDVEYRNRKVGRVFGPTWTARISHKTRRSRVSFQYQETTQSYEQVTPFRGDSVLVKVAPEGGLTFFDPLTGDPLVVSGTEFFSLTDSVINRRRGSLNYTYRLARSTFQLSLFRERRTEFANGNEQVTSGVNAAWDWRFGAWSRLLVHVNRQRLDFVSATGNTDYLLVSVGVNRDLGARSMVGLFLMRSGQDTSSGTADFTENRVTLSFQTRF